MAKWKITDLIDSSIKFIQFKEHRKKRQEKLTDTQRSVGEHQVYQYMSYRSPKRRGERGRKIFKEMTKTFQIWLCIFKNSKNSKNRSNLNPINNTY